MNGGRCNPWTDAYGVPIAEAARVEQVGVAPSQGALLRRRGKLGVVAGRGATRVAVRFDGEEHPATVRPKQLRVVELPGGEAVGLTDMTDGFHWHIYTRSVEDEVLSAPTPDDRQDRLATRPDTVLRSPVSVAEWIAQRTAHGELFRLWCPASGRWTVHDGAARDVLHMEAVQLVARALNIYVTASTSSGPRLEVFAEGVTVFDCPEQGRHVDPEPTGEA